MRDSPRPRDAADDDRNPAADAGDPSDDGPRPDRNGVEGDPERSPLEPGSPSAENALFVLLGVALTVTLLLSTVLPSPL